jgi:His Kinase A (phospho-acceptor) domain
VAAVPDSKAQSGARTSDDADTPDHDSADLERAHSDVRALARDGARAASQASADPLASTLLASARHELRSPLQSVQGFAELLGSESYGTLTEEQHSFVSHILQGSLELGAVLEACLELVELHVTRPQLELQHVDLQAELTSALELAAKSSGTALSTRIGSGLAGARLLVDRVTLRRSLQTLLTGLATGTSKTFRAELTLDGRQVELTLGTPKRALGAPLISIDEFARRRRATRSLLWLRLASSLLALQGGVLLVTEQLDCVEVRLSLSSTH